MRLFSRLLAAPEKRSLTDSDVIRLLTGGSTTAGVAVNPDTALSSTAVLAAVRVLSESIASLPLIVYRKDGRAKERAPEHPLYRVLHDQANRYMTAFGLRRLQIAHMALYGNAYAEIVWDGSGRIAELLPLHPSRVGVEVSKETGEVQYTYWSEKNGGVVLPAWRVFHLRWLESDGIVGQSPIKLAANAVGLGLAMEQFGASYFANGARPSVILKHPAKLSDEAYERLRATFSTSWAGLSNAHRVQILEEAMDVTTVGVPPEEAQLLEARKFQVSEIARMFRLPPHLVGDLERSTNNNIEHQGIEFLQFTLTPMLVSIEQEIRRQLMTPAELETYDVEHLVDGLLRGDSTTRTDVQVKRVQNGLLSINEARAQENLNPIPEGDVFFQPMNVGVLGQPAQPVRGPQDGPQDHQPQLPDMQHQEGAARFLPLYNDVAQRLVKREVSDLRRAVDKHLRKKASVADFVGYLDEFYGDLLRVVPEMYGALVAVRASGNPAEQRILAANLVTVGTEYMQRNRQQLVELAQGAQDAGAAADAVENWLSAWQESGAEWLAQQTLIESK